MKKTRAILVPVKSKNAGERQPHQRNISPERRLRGEGTHLLDAEAQKQHCTKRRQHDQPDHERHCNLLIEAGRDSGIRDEPGHAKPGRHEVVDLQRVPPQAEVEIDRPDTGTVDGTPPGTLIEGRIVRHDCLKPLLAAAKHVHTARGAHNPKPIDAHYHAIRVGNGRRLP